MFKYLVLTLKGSTCEHKLIYDYINIEFPLKMCQLKLQTKGPLSAMLIFETQIIIISHVYFKSISIY